LTEIKCKFQSDVLVEFPGSKTIGNLITKLFHGVKIKPGRCKDNWAKSTQRYHVLVLTMMSVGIGHFELKLFPIARLHFR
jgi:hypothetical protein